MVEFRNQDLSGSVFDDVDLTGARFSNVLMRNVTMRGAWAERLSIDGGFEELLFNGIDVVPLWRAELRRQHPEYRPARARRPPRATARSGRCSRSSGPPPWPGPVSCPRTCCTSGSTASGRSSRRCDTCCSSTDAWLRRAVLGEAAPYDPLDLPHDEMRDLDGVPRDPDARPSLDEVLRLRSERVALVRGFFAELTDEQAAGETTATGPGYPEAGTYTVSRCLHAVLDEEWSHRRYAERDLRALEAR